MWLGTQAGGGYVYLVSKVGGLCGQILGDKSTLFPAVNLKKKKTFKNFKVLNIWLLLIVVSFVYNFG